MRDLGDGTDAEANQITLAALLDVAAAYAWAAPAGSNLAGWLAGILADVPTSPYLTAQRAAAALLAVQTLPRAGLDGVAQQLELLAANVRRTARSVAPDLAAGFKGIRRELARRVRAGPVPIAELAAQLWPGAPADVAHNRLKAQAAGVNRSLARLGCRERLRFRDGQALFG